MNQRGFSLVLLLLGAVATLAAIGAYYSAHKKQSLPQASTQTRDEQVTDKTSAAVELSKAWGLGTLRYSNPKINIAFEYPSYFELRETNVEKDNEAWAKEYKNNPSVRQPLYKSSFYLVLSTPNFQPKSSSDDTASYAKEVDDICTNTMRISVQMYTNSKRMMLYEFIANLNKEYSGNGITETFDTYKKNLKLTALPKESSYVFEGIVSENPVKTVYFMNGEKVYSFDLIGSCGTGGRYTDDADKVLTSMLKSVKFLD